VGPEVRVTGGELLRELAVTLAAGGVPESRREALRLWRELSGDPVTEALVRPDEPVGTELAAALRKACGRRAAGEPLAHVAGRAGFRRLIVRSDRRALIPRPETEGLVDLLLARVHGGAVLDIGTGTGAVALALASEGTFTTVTATDLSADALALARQNLTEAGLPVDLVRSDLCAALRPGAFDALASNPPYLSGADYAALDPGVRDWEPEEALVGGLEGAELTLRLLTEAREVLRPGGWLAVELDCTRAEACARRASALGWDEVTIQADLFGRDRYLLARRSVAT
jgi:release factor glutamine methyltransferase